MPVTLRHPRQRKDTAFQALVDKVYAAVAGKTEAELLGAAPGQPGRRQLLPRARLNALAGLLEKVAGEGERADLYRLSSELVLDLDDLLPIVEAGEILGFVTVQEGDLLLTPLGRAYAEASILTRKELVAGRILRLPVLSWIYETLHEDDNKRVAKEFFLDKLQADFADKAEDQLQIAIQWGRHAELFGFDDDTDELFLEP
jgi:NitT/TauT family transport system ATP-binding protein